MAVIEINTQEVMALVAGIGPGCLARFRNGRYTAPIRLCNINDDHEIDPRRDAVILEPLCYDSQDPLPEPGEDRAKSPLVITMGLSADDFRREANLRSLERQDQGGYPGLGRWMMDGRLCLTNCHHVTIRGFHFEKSWPTHIALKNCSHITIENCTFEDGTFAIGADGEGCRHITIRNCNWVQDTVPHRMWRHLSWNGIHAHLPQYRVDVENDWRLFDGDFFRGFRIDGDVEIANCHVKAAFNAIHFYSDRDSPDDWQRYTRNINVHGCLFEEVRDNVFEPEFAAQNIWFHRNRIFNCHKWFSLECAALTHCYIFANVGWFNTIQSRFGPNENRGGGVFKLYRHHPKHIKTPKGPNFVFHNSIATRGDYIRKGFFPGLEHRNNAVQCIQQAGAGFNEFPLILGRLDSPESGDGYWKKRFSVDWETYGVSMRGDAFNHPDWPDAVKNGGYPDIRPLKKAAPISFNDPVTATLDGTGLRLSGDTYAGAAKRLKDLPLPNGKSWTAPEETNPGAWQHGQSKLTEGFDWPDFVPMTGSPVS